MRFKVLGAGQRLKVPSDDTTFENRRSFEIRSRFENRITFENHLRKSKTLKNNYKNNKSYYSTLTLLINPTEKRKPFSKNKRILIKFKKKNDELPNTRTKSTKGHSRTILGKDNYFHSLTYLFP